MRNLLTKTTDLAMYLTLAYIRKGDYVIDATCGNGGDTAALAEAVGQEGAVLAVDIQKAAVESTAKRLTEIVMNNVTIVQDSFCRMEQISEEYFPGKSPAAVVFNLGYLPGGNKQVTTTAEDTETAVRRAADLIRKDGVVTVVMYDGHGEGAREKEQLLAMAGRLPKDRYHVVFASMPNQQTGRPPEVLWITRKK